MTQAVPPGWSLSDTEMFLRYGDIFVPRRAEQIGVVGGLLADLPVAHVLDLCCGEGRLSEEFLRRWPAGRVTLLDGSAEMLDAAARRLAALGGRFEPIQAGLSDRGWRQAARYGGVMTSLAVHHLDGAAKRQLYRDVHEMLLPGGAFVLADLVEPAGAAARELAADQWDQAVARGSREVFGSDQAAAVFRDTQWNYFRLPGPDPVDHPSSAAEHLSWLAGAGFAEVDVAWMYAGHAIFTARRALEP